MAKSASVTIFENKTRASSGQPTMFMRYSLLFLIKGTVLVEEVNRSPVILQAYRQYCEKSIKKVVRKREKTCKTFKKMPQTVIQPCSKLGKDVVNTPDYTVRSKFDGSSSLHIILSKPIYVILRAVLQAKDRRVSKCKGK